MKRDISLSPFQFGLLIVFSVITSSVFAVERKPQRLLSAFEWNQLCNKSTGSESECKSRIFRATLKGRSLGTYELITPDNPSLLLSRSGVVLGNNLNSHVLEVREDKGLITVLKLTNDVTCQAYSAPPDLVGVPNAGINYGRLINSWLAVYSDDPSQVRNVSLGRNSALSSMQFEAVMTKKNRGIRGVYWLDTQAHASIFSTCDFPLEVAKAEDTAEIFFGSIVGSSRRYLRD
jgi:hypothetical protein